MDPLDVVDFQCPDCRVVLRDTPDALVCLACGYRVLFPDVGLPGFEGPSIRGG